MLKPLIYFNCFRFDIFDTFEVVYSGKTRFRFYQNEKKSCKFQERPLIFKKNLYDLFEISDLLQNTLLLIINGLFKTFQEKLRMGSQNHEYHQKKFFCGSVY